MADTTLIHVRVEQDLAEAIDRAAAERQIKRSEVIRLALRSAFLGTPKEPPSVARRRPEPAPRPDPPARAATPAHPAQIDQAVWDKLQRKYRR